MRSTIAAVLLLALAPAVLAQEGKPAEKRQKEKVVVGAYVEDIQALDLRTHSYAADVYVWFRWRDGALDRDGAPLDPSKSVGFINAAELWGHSYDFDRAEGGVVLPSGERYQLRREHGRFSKKLILTEYPFDQQVLTIVFEDKQLDAEALEFVADAEGAITIDEALLIPGFIVGEPKLIIEPHAYPTNFGEPGTAKNVFSRVRIEIPIHRPVVTHGIKLFVPILCVVLCAALMFLFNPRWVEARAGIGITALLTIVALQITLNDDLPEIDYLVLIDKVYLAAYLYTIAGLGVVVRTSWLIDAQGSEAQEARCTRIDRLSLIALSAGFALLTAILVIPALLA